jgi:short-subunit dehydrogenase
LGLGRATHPAYRLFGRKFAVKRFTEALITDLRINAPHIKCSVVMPGQIGTSIRANTRKIHSGDREANTEAVQTAVASLIPLNKFGPRTAALALFG